MTIRVQTFENSNDFLATAEPYLLLDEVTNSLLLGAVMSVSRQSINRRRFRPRFAYVEEAGKPVAAVAWTLARKLVLSAELEISDEVLSQLVVRLSENKAAPEAIFGPDVVAKRLAQIWADTLGSELQVGMEQRLFVLREVSLPPAPLGGGQLYPASPWNRDLLAEWVAAFQSEAIPDGQIDSETALLITERLLMDENLFIWLAEPNNKEPQPVAMAARARPTQRGIAINLVYTPPEFRRQGYATALVAQLSQHLLQTGWEFCTLFTDVRNPTSNHIYQSIGYTPVTDFTDYNLVPGG